MSNEEEDPTRSVYLKFFISKKIKKVIIKPSDKRGSVVVMDVLQYESKCNLLLQDMDTYQTLTINPLPKLTRTFNAIVKENIPSNLMNVVKKKFPSLSYLFGIPKVHMSRECPLDQLYPAVALICSICANGLQNNFVLCLSLSRATI